MSAARRLAREAARARKDQRVREIKKGLSENMTVPNITKSPRFADCANKVRSLAEIEASAQAKYGKGGEPYAFYAARCCWWTSDSRDLGSADGTLPCCPYCGSVLFEAPLAKFIASARESPSHYGPRGLDAFADAHHGSGLHAVSWEAYGSDSDLKPTFPRFVRPSQAPPDPAAPKSHRCVRCRSEFNEAELDGSICPKCGDPGIPSLIAQDVTLTINWHELRILVMWAERWADACDRNEPESGSRAVDAVKGIASALEAQRPADFPPLTLAGEIAAVQESYPDAELLDGDGNVIVPKKTVN